MLRCLAAALLGLLLCSVPRAAPDDPTMFVLETAEGKAVRGPLKRLGEAWEIDVGDAELHGKDWLTLKRVGKAVPSQPIDCHLVLTNGDFIPVAAASLSLTGERLTFTSPWLSKGKPSVAPLSSVALIWRAAPEQGDAPWTIRRRLLDGKRRHDAVVLRNGDVLDGILQTVGPETVELDVSRKKTPIDTKQVALIALSSDLASGLKPRGSFARVILADGSRLTLSSTICDGKTLTGISVLGVPVQVDLDQLVRLDLSQGRVTHLGDLTPKQYEHTPYLSVSWPLVVNGSVSGRDLRLAGSVFDRGIGMHSASRVSYVLPAGTRYFQATVGLDDVTGRKGSVRVRVLLDGKERNLGRERDLKVGETLEVWLDVASARELTLVVDFGEGGDVGDHVNWVDARLIR